MSIIFGTYGMPSHLITTLISLSLSSYGDRENQGRNKIIARYDGRLNYRRERKHELVGVQSYVTHFFKKDFVFIVYTRLLSVSS